MTISLPNQVTMDNVSEVSSNAMAAVIQESMKNDLETLRPAEDLCHLGQLFEGCHSTEFEGEHNAEQLKRDVTDTPIEELRVCCAGWMPFQTICALFCGCPSCIGCVGQCTLLFCMCKFVNCKMLDCKDEDSRCCAVQQCNWFLTAPNKLLEAQCQLCCVDYRTAGPCCSKKVPCYVSVLGYTCCADWKCKTGCMKRVGDQIPRYDERVGKGDDA